MSAYDYVAERDDDEAMRLHAIDREERQRAQRTCIACGVNGGHVFNCPAQDEDEPESVDG
jgi:hypothetical protein